MKRRIMHMVCTALLAIGPHLFMAACSSAPEEDGDLEASEQTTDQGAPEDSELSDAPTNAEAEPSTNTAENSAEETGFDNTASAQAVDNTQMADESQVLQGNDTKSDLEQIIAGSNGAPVENATAVPVASDATASTPSATPAMAAAPALPEQGSKMPYVVRFGESLSSIAKQVYGKAESWTEMAELSSISNPNLVKPGDVVYYQLTQETLAFASAYEGATRSEVTVQKGDTLAAISARVYGNTGDWKFVWRQNANISDPDKLEVGQTIVYLNQNAFQQAYNYAKSINIAELINKTIGVSQSDLLTDNMGSDVQQELNSHSVSGFEIVKTAFGVFAPNGTI